jgi:hypothetical protein
VRTLSNVFLPTLQEILTGFIALLVACCLLAVAEAGDKKIYSSDTAGVSQAGNAHGTGDDARLSEEAYGFAEQLTRAYKEGDIDAYISFYSK